MRAEKSSETWASGSAIMRFTDAISPESAAGRSGRACGCRLLAPAGFRILIRGYRTAQGEIDLIARDGATLVFVEVKARRQGVPAEAVTAEKQCRLTLAALRFLKEHGLLEQRCRFDVVAIVWPDRLRARPSNISETPSKPRARARCFAEPWAPTSPSPPPSRFRLPNRFKTIQNFSLSGKKLRGLLILVRVLASTIDKQPRRT